MQVVREGRDLAIVVMGSIGQEAALAAEELSVHGVEAAVVVVSNFSPDPEAGLIELLPRFRRVLSVEVQTLSGGLGSLVASVIATHGLACRLWPMGVRTPPDGTSGNLPERLRRHGLNCSGIVKAALGAVSE